jgi:hypothetical protein
MVVDDGEAIELGLKLGNRRRPAAQAVHTKAV